MLTQKYIDELSYRILVCAIEVHKHMDQGSSRVSMKQCFIRELGIRNLNFQTQRKVPVNYKGTDLIVELRFDVLVEDLIIVELKSVEGMLPVHDAILLSYMRMLQKPKGILINFNCINIFQFGQKTLVNEYYARLPKH